MKNKQELNIVIKGTDDPKVMENFYNNLADFMADEIGRQISKMNISYEEKKRLIDKLIEKNSSSSPSGQKSK